MVLPTLNAGLNGLSALGLIVGFVFIKRGIIPWHRRFMVGAFLCSTVFLVNYLTYHALAGHTMFRGSGWVRKAYVGILVSHSLLAAMSLPMALVTLRRGLANRLEAHRALARWTLPIWLYVSVTGVVVYGMLYRGWGL